MRSRVALCISALTILGALFTLGSTATYAAVPDSINYQGILKIPGGSPVPDGSYSVTLSIYDVASGPNPALWTETKSVTIVGGVFNTLLGSVTALPPSLFSGSLRFLGITINPDPEMTPRTAIVAVPYAYRVATVDGATGGSISADVSVAGGNLNLDHSTATAGNILKSGALFIHDFGNHNIFVGRDAGNLTMSGGDNTVSGTYALHSNTTGEENTASGSSALFNNTTGNGNTASGKFALVANTTGDDNTANGDYALRGNTTGSGNTACGAQALWSNTGPYNTASGFDALFFNSSGSGNTASGAGALLSNATGGHNTATGYLADVSTGDLFNATAIGYNAKVDASNKIRLGDAYVTVIEGQVAFTFPSDSTQKENFRPVNGDEVLSKIRGFNLRSWNYIGNNPQQFRHYGPMAQEFFAAFGHDDVGTSGTPTTINSGDEAGILMIAIQALDRRTAENADLKARIEKQDQQIAELREMIRAQASKQK